MSINSRPMWHLFAKIIYFRKSFYKSLNVYSQETVTLYHNLIYSAFTLSCLINEAVKRNYASSVTRVRVDHQIIRARISWKHWTASDFVVIENRTQFFFCL